MSREKIVSREAAEEIKNYRKNVKNYYTDRRLYAVQLRGEGHRNKDIAEKLNADPRQVSQWVRVYLERGLEALSNEGGGGRPFKLTLRKKRNYFDLSLRNLSRDRRSGSRKSRGHTRGLPGKVIVTAISILC